LKQIRIDLERKAIRRPRAGAWIETGSMMWLVSVMVVAPARGRGLKRADEGRNTRRMGRPRAGAWIETIINSFYAFGIRSPPRGGVD